MTDLDALLAGIVADPHNALRWLIVADWLDDHDQPDRAELLRLHRELIRTCCEPDQHPERAEWQRRVVELIDLGVKPCVPQHTLMLPGDVPLVGNFIPPGSFLMGSLLYDDEKPVHRVELSSGFFLGISPVTQAQWQAVMGESRGRFKGDDLPVESLNWDHATTFCTRAAGIGHQIRLPTEAEWEYAVRSGTTTHYHYGDVPDVTRMNYDAEHRWNGSPKGLFRERTTPVDSFPTNPWGLFDCHGNVWEWCADWYDEGFYARCPPVDPECRAMRAPHRALRGGAWINFPLNCRAASRIANRPDGSGDLYGFRIAFTLN